jgi:hypothetical protein
MDVKPLPVVDTRDYRAGPAVWRVVSWERADSPIVRAQDADDLVFVAIIQCEKCGTRFRWHSMCNRAIKVAREGHHGWGDNQRTLADDQRAARNSARGDAALPLPGDIYNADTTSVSPVNCRVWTFGEQLFSSFRYGDAGGYGLRVAWL